MAADKHWRVLRPEDFLSREFAEGVVLYDVRNKQTLYLPHPAGWVFSVLGRDFRGSREADIADVLARSSDACAIGFEELEVVFDELERLKLITASP